MGIFDKLKNALFEEEYVEVEEKPKVVKQSPKNVKKKESVKEDIDNKINDEKPIAKKVVLPEKRESSFDDAKVSNFDKDDFLSNMPNDQIYETVESKRQFKIMDDNDFTMDEQPRRYKAEVEPQIVKVIEKEVARPLYSYQNEKDNLYHGRIPNQPYGSMESPKTTVNDYHTYETRIEEKTHFKPSPIISPIYGVLDKNYKKEDVVSKREVKISSSFSREKLNFDDIRKKAFGTENKETNDDVKKNNFKPTFEIETTSNLLVDLSSDDSKPSVKDVTVGDAVEYFEDLGLEYNVDYLDASKKSNNRRVKDDYDKVVSSASDVVNDEPKFVESKNETLDDDDNLFDLIDSMYQEEQ